MPRRHLNWAICWLSFAALRPVIAQAIQRQDYTGSLANTQGPYGCPQYQGGACRAASLKPCTNASAAGQNISLTLDVRKQTSKEAFTLADDDVQLSGDGPSHPTGTTHRDSLTLYLINDFAKVCLCDLIIPDEEPPNVALQVNLTMQPASLSSQPNATVNNISFEIPKCVRSTDVAVDDADAVSSAGQTCGRSLFTN